MNYEQEFLLTINSGPTGRLRPVWDPLTFAIEYDAENESSIPEHEYMSVIEESTRIMDTISGEIDPITTSKVVGMEVGDDRVDLSQNPMILSCMIITQSKIFGMKTSESDTYISKFDWNFCEVTSQIPCAPEESLDYARKTNFQNLGFTDSPTLRIVIDVQKGDRSHSSTVVGKASLLGSRLKTPRASNRLKLELASWVQDACLSTHRAPEPKYIHKIMGGSGCPALYNEPVNTFLYLKGYKNGTYQRVYASAINEAKQCVYGMDSHRLTAPVLCSKLRQKQEYLHITYASNIAIPPSQELNAVDQEMAPIVPVYRAAGTESFIQGMENRLIQSRKLITYRAACIEIMRRNRILNAIFNVENIKEANLQEKLLSLQKREQFNGALRANAAVQNLLNRQADGSEIQKLLGEGFLVTGSGTTELLLSDIQWLHDGGKGEVFTIDDLSTSEDMYLRTEVTMEESLRVGGIPLNTKFNKKSSRISYTRAEIGLWQMSAEKEEWAETVTSTLLSVREAIGRPLQYSDTIDVFYKYREWVQDDSLIIAKIIEDNIHMPRYTVMLLTTDRRLCRNIAKTTGLNVILCPPEPVIYRLERQKVINDDLTVADFMEALEIDNLGNSQLPQPMKIYIDKGSTDRAFMRMEPNSGPHGNPTGSTNRKTFIKSGYLDGKRYTLIKLEKLENKSTFPMIGFSANGEELKFFPTFSWEKLRRESGIFSRNLRLSRRFSKNTKGA